MSTQVTQRKKLETIKDFMNSPEMGKKLIEIIESELING